MESFVLFIPWDVSQDKGGSGEGWFRMGEGEGEEVCQEGWWWWGVGPCVSWVNLLFPADVKNTVCNRLLVNHYSAAARNVVFE